jgi:nucleoside-diphosphate-sugar epimerase
VRIVVIGATGNVGTSLVQALVDDAEVTSIVGVARRLPGWRPPRTTWVQADVARDDLVTHLRGADAVVHLAWLFQPTHRPDITWRTNVRGSLRVFDAAAQAGVGTLVYASSVGTYAPGPKDRPVDESWSTDGLPSAAYSREKAAVEDALDTFESRHPYVRVVRLRPGFIFKAESAPQQRRLFAGPLLPGRLVGRRQVPVLPDLPGLRFQVLHSADAAQAYRLALTRPVRGAFNVAADPVVDADLLADVFDARVLRLPAAPVRVGLAALWRLHAVPVEPGLLELLLSVPLLDTARARDELGWTPRHDAREALEAFLDGLRAGTGMDTPPLHPRAGGRLRQREVASGVGRRP